MKILFLIGFSVFLCEGLRSKTTMPSTPHKGRKDSKSPNCSQKGKLVDNEVSDEDSESLYLCAECNSEIGNSDKALLCDMCENWFCNKKCLNFNNADYTRIGKTKENDGVMWFCKHCRISFPGTKKIVSRFNSMEKRQDLLESKFEELEKKIDSNGNKEKLDLSEVVGNVLTEQSEREKRKLNVICFGLSESNELNDASQIDRVEVDKEKLNKIMDEVLNLKDFEFSNPIRLGRYDSGNTRARPIKFTVNNAENKRLLLERARMYIRKSPNEMCKDLYFNSDLTPTQRREEYMRRMARKNSQRFASEHHNMRNRTGNGALDTFR